MTSSSLFGTDGIRGPFGAPPLDRLTLERLGIALGRLLRLDGESRPVMLAGDTRASTAEICRWLAAGLTAEGARCTYGGVLPTPAVSRLVPELELPVGIAVSASHNPFPDNGVKLLGTDGSKWSQEQERHLEDVLRQIPEPDLTHEPPPLNVDGSLEETYRLGLATVVTKASDLSNLRVTLDCSNGAASVVAPRVFSALGAAVDVIGNTPNGTNINDNCGSTAPRAMASRTVEAGSQVGFAFDGDADRVIVSDEQGAVRDGDAILFLLARHLKGRGELEPSRIVATSMSNLGLQVALEDLGIDIVRCDVGDRVVVDALRANGLLLGGEQSGHIVHLGHGPTGDGIQTALLLSQILAADSRTLSEQLQGFRTYPQILRNVVVATKPDLLSIPSIQKAATEVEEDLGRSGRLVLRYSGTEPLARIMIEGPDQQHVEDLAARLAEVIQTEIGAEG